MQRDPRLSNKTRDEGEKLNYVMKGFPSWPRTSRFIEVECLSCASTESKLQKFKIPGLRKRMVPAYTFELSPKLPTEIQYRIWSLAARVEETPPNIHRVVCMHDEPGQNGEFNYKHFSKYLKGSSQLLSTSSRYVTCLDESTRLAMDRETLPIIFQICSDSRKIGQEIFAKLPIVHYQNMGKSSKMYYHTRYDSIYLGKQKFGGDTWSEFKILVDLLLKQHTTRSFKPAVQREMEQFKKIQNLIVDLKVFAGAPLKLWAEFPKLEQLTIAFYPFDQVYQPETLIAPGLDIEPKFFVPKAGSKYATRAAWILQSVTASLERVVRKQLPGWKVPRIKVLARKTWNYHLDNAVQHGLPMPIDQGAHETDGQDHKEQGDDSAWYESAARAMTYHVPIEEIKSLKHKFLSCRKVDPLEWWLSGPREEMLKCEYKEYYTDSEGEEGQEAAKRMGYR
jgi:hypothetical protein